MTPESESPTLPALIAELLRDQLGIPRTPPRVFVYNTNWDIPKITSMFLSVAILGEDNYGAGSGYGLDGTTHDLIETQQLAQSFTITVDAFSANTEARRRLPEIFFALTGDAAERLMESNNLRIFRPQPFQDLSQLEASRRLNRFQTQFAVYQSAGASRPVPYMQVAKKPVGKLLIEA